MQPRNEIARFKAGTHRKEKQRQMHRAGPRQPIVPNDLPSSGT